MNLPVNSANLPHQDDQYVYYFGGGTAEGNATMRNLLGGKGANLAEMCAIGLPVPPGCTITTEVCNAYYEQGKQLPNGLKEQLSQALGRIERDVDARFGDASNPLLVSVRSGSRASMPGMMDTVLNLGLNDVTVEGLAQRTQNARFAYDSYRRFIQMYADVVLGVPHYYFEDAIENLKMEQGYVLDTEATADDLRELCDHYKSRVEAHTGVPFPQDPQEQLWGAILAVFDSWMNRRAITYRTLHHIPESWGTAVNVQAMVFGNMGDDCATGVAFTRNPSTGVAHFYGEYLVNAQGEDVVAGIRTPQSLTIASKEAGDTTLAMEESMPEVFRQLEATCALLETHYKDMQDIEFTVQNHKLWILQTRAGKRTAAAAVKIAIDMAQEGLISQHEALLRVDPLTLDQLLHPTLDPNAPKHFVTRGLPASPGAASGRIVFSADEAEIRAKMGEKLLLVRIETSPEDIHGMHVAQGILTARGGMTSHAAVVARGMGKPCVSGASSVHIDYKTRTMHAGAHQFSEGDWITIDGATGDVYEGVVPTISADLSGDFERLMHWADAVRTLKIRTNADTPEDAKVARNFGAEGIGLCRTEHMFFDAQKIIAVRQMILSETLEERQVALAKILPMQRQDFIGIFHAMHGLPVTIRLLDPPLHEFLPRSEQEMREVANHAGISIERIRERAHALHEANPMLGHRGCRLGITYPEIYTMQARAILEAAYAVRAEHHITVLPEIMIPLVMHPDEVRILKNAIDEVAADVAQHHKEALPYMVGTMIELPRAALLAGAIAPHAQFFSFGTNDLTQTTLGISRDDAGSFLGAYKKHGMFDHDPFVTLDVEGVGQLIHLACERGRAVRSDMKLGICGEHGGDPASIAFCHKMGMDYVSCSPFRVPIARLAAAHAVLKAEQ
ncbi:MAG: pyruvate, phosphate dikinase [Alphaproteobacteria bacterium]|nr:MAG: pyruvate, phosphate dikinase [Alphaproteobacteria bacterium]TAF39307.1 MAG: pyruvate, phosphate dikinase [Alphaproteobacteria bacterium]TAF75007.1 MAG: pyruvate, phosphate dikinase [Alphaproteobacteria bacterium]